MEERKRVIKICHFTSVHPDKDIRIFHKECASLSEANFDVHLVVPNSRSRSEKGITIHSFDYTPSSRISRILLSAKKTYQLARSLDADIYHFHDPELLPYGLKLKKNGKIVIYDAHEDVPRQILGKLWIPKMFRSAISRIFELYENHVCRRLSFVVTSTPTIKKRFIEVNKNCEAICNYPIIGENINPIPWSNKKDEICYIGGLSSERGIKELIQSLEYVEASTILHLAGNYSPASFRGELSCLKGWNSTKEYGFVDRNEVTQILNQSKIGIVTLHPRPNYLDSLPIKLYEYMLAGIPVIASDFPLWKEIVEENNCGICVDALNPKEIASAISYLLMDNETASAMGKNGRKLVLETCNWDIEKEKLIRLYQNLLNSF